MINYKNPTISIITVTWNCDQTVKECLASVAAQTYSHYEHVVIDGASTDNTLAILTAHTHQLAVLKSEPDAGIYDALNKGISLACGDVVGFLHADDLYASSNVLANIAAAFEDPTVCAVYGDLQYVSKTNTARVVRHWTSSPFNPRRLAWGWMPPHTTLYVRSEWYECIGGFDTRYRIAADYLSILQMFSQADFKSAYLPEVLVKMRLGGVSNKSFKNLLCKSAEDWRALRSMNVGALGVVRALFWKNLSKLLQLRW